MSDAKSTELSGPGDPAAQPKQPGSSRQIRGCLAPEDGAAKQTTDRITDLARDLTRQLIDIGAACQKARSFSVATAATPLRSVYDVYAERVEAKLREALND